jgi:hypothetical protein
MLWTMQPGSIMRANLPQSAALGTTSPKISAASFHVAVPWVFFSCQDTRRKVPLYRSPEFNLAFLVAIGTNDPRWAGAEWDYTCDDLSRLTTLPKCTPEELASAYHRKVLEWHPDKLDTMAQELKAAGVLPSLTFGSERP